MYNYSIIIPHHKSLNLLDRLLKSIPDRDDIQIIVVDDNSGIEQSLFDNLSQFSYAKLSFVFLKANKGAGGARNEGLSVAVGKWLLFADADDFFLPSAFDISDKYLASNYDIIYFGIRSVDSETYESVDRYKVYNRYIDPFDENIDESKEVLRFKHDVPWGKMIRSSLVDSNYIRFDETRYCNDTIFSTKTALNAISIYADVSPFYCVTERSGSLITQQSIEATYIRYEVILRKNMMLREYGKGRYQHSILPFLKKLAHYGISPLCNGIRMGIKYRANFLIGFSDILKTRICK